MPKPYLNLKINCVLELVALYILNRVQRLIFLVHLNVNQAAEESVAINAAARYKRSSIIKMQK